MENTVEVRIPEVTKDISLEDDITRDGKSPNKNLLQEQDHQPDCTISNE